eukprot:3792067-Karenia_brevis.AAC.1
MAHVSEDLSLADARGQDFMLLHKHVIVIEEHPTRTRFWTFSACVNGLLRMKLMKIPSSVISIHG